MDRITRDPDPSWRSANSRGYNDRLREKRVGAGDSFFVPKGANTTWVIYDTVSKSWTITER
jgi:uncharacterized cupin superfamily protein